MAKVKLHEFEELFHSLTSQLNPIHQTLKRSVIDLQKAYDTYDALCDLVIPSNFVDELID